MIPARVRIDEWPGLRDLLSLRVIEIMVMYEANRPLEVILTVDGPRYLQPKENERYHPANESKLAIMLAEMFNRSYKRQGHPERVILRGRLGVDVIHGLDGVLRMQIWRKGMSPSDKEWETVLKHLPFEAGVTEPERFEHKGAFYLRAIYGG